MSKKLYYIISLAAIILGLSSSVLLSYTYFKGYNTIISLFCSDSGYLDCSSVISGKYSSIFGLPISVLGVWLYIMAALYLIFPLMNNDKKNYLYGLLFWMLILANIANLALLLVSIFEKNSLCTFCVIHYISTLMLTFAVLRNDFKNKVIKESKSYFKSLWSNRLYKKDVITFVIVGLFMLSSLFLFSQSTLNSWTKLKFESSFFKQKILDFDAKNVPFIGDSNAPAKFLVFHDYQCGVCLNSYYEFKALAKEYPKLVKVQYINFPFFSSSRKSKFDSNKLSQYSLVAHKFGKYFEFTELIYESLQKKIYIDLNRIKEIFKKLNITKPFSEIEKIANESSAEIDRQKAFAKKVGVRGTPTILFNGRVIPSGHNKRFIDKLIEVTKLSVKTGKRIEDLVDLSTPSVKPKPASSKLISYFRKPVFNFDAKDAPFIGVKDAPVKFLVFHDYQCGFCLRSYYEFKALAKEYPKLVKVQYINFPFFGATKKSKLVSNELAKYSLAAHKFGKYFEFTELIYESIKNNVPIDLNQIKAIFKKLNITKPFSQIEKIANESSAEIDRQKAFAKKVGVRGTPTILLNGRVAGSGHDSKLISEFIEVTKLSIKTGKKIEDLVDLSVPPVKPKPAENKLASYFKQPVFNFDAKDAPFIGVKDAPVKFLVFHDYQCGFCLRSYYEFKALAKEYPKLVKVQYINFPFFGATRKSKLVSNELAKYSLAAHKFGKYFEFTELIYESIKNNVPIDLNQIKAIFKKLNITKPFSQIEKIANESSAEIDRQKAFAKKVGVNGTPTILLNGRIAGSGHDGKLIGKLIDLTKLSIKTGKKIEDLVDLSAPSVKPKPAENKLVSYFKQPVFNFDAKDAPFIGVKDAPVKFLVFHDYQCGFCLRSYYEFKALAKEYPKLVKVQYINFPFFGATRKSKLVSNELAKYSLAAHKFGKYFEFTELIYESIKNNVLIDLNQIKAIFKKLNITKPFSRIEKIANESSAEIDRQKAFAKKVGVRGTPTILLNGRIAGSGHDGKLIGKLIDLTKLSIKTGKKVEDLIKAGN